jgi:penicillin-binding protein 2
LDDHVVFEDLSLEAVAEIEAHPERYPGARIVERRRRVYPSGLLAANLLGHLGPHDAADTEDRPGDEDRDAPPQAADALVGRMGIERRFESALRGQDGQSLQRSNRSGAVLSTERRLAPRAGRDVTLSIDSALQRAAESLLDQTLARRMRRPAAEEAGGAVVAVDIETGDVLALASAPRFDPNPFASGDQAAIQEALEQPAHPLFDRASRMAIPPGSVFKALSAAALLESGATTADEAFYCQGYLRQPNRQRCMIYRRHQRGHERVTLLDALAQSCNVYFFHFAEQMGPGPLVSWAEKFGFGQPTGIDLPDESPGELPTPETVRARQGHGWREGDTLALAIGQGDLTATPLQIARLFAAIANGGRLPTPRVALRVGLANEGRQSADGDVEHQSFDGAPERRPPRSIEGLHPSTLAALRRGLEQVVADSAGTGHRTVYCESVAIAGKTGTAETGGGRGDHAWFAGYAPAEAPRVAFVVALEHGGSGDEAAGPIAKRLVQKMQSLGYFGKGRMAKNPLTWEEGRARGGR